MFPVTKSKFDASRLLVSWQEPPGGVYLAPLHGGDAMFPINVKVTARYENGPLMEMATGVDDGRPVITQFGLTSAEGGPPISASMIDALPLGAIFDQVVEVLATSGLAFFRAVGAAKDGRAHIFLSDEERERAANAASRRGRPVSDQILRRVADIVRANPYSPRADIRAEIAVSERTASRWISEAKRRGFLDDEITGGPGNG